MRQYSKEELEEMEELRDKLRTKQGIQMIQKLAQRMFPKTSKEMDKSTKVGEGNDKIYSIN